MSWSYDPDGQDGLNTIRLMVGDTDTTDQMTQDEEINLALAMYAQPADKPPYLAAAWICDAIAGRFGRQIDASVGPLQQTASQMFDHYRALAQQFRVMYATDGQGIIDSGGSGAYPGSVFAGIKAGAPILGGGGPTYLGTNTYIDPEGL